MPDASLNAKVVGSQRVPIFGRLEVPLAGVFGAWTCPDDQREALVALLARDLDRGHGSNVSLILAGVFS